MIKRGVMLAVLIASPLAAQEAAEDGVISSCLAKGNSTEVCICASLVLHARVGDDDYARFGDIEDRMAELSAGADEQEGELMALMSEGYRFFIPHGQAISVCAKKVAAGE